ncbi:MAG: patatin-like phospholipase family protein [Bacteroidales bacterium]|nr:patatin-like phospholipase family protein [Bacteroidales bacterium]
MKWYFIIFLNVLILSTKAQKVGLVLSGGGAKGIAHIGVIKALEENGIPIDYITGTSMGAIIGALYAVGYSPSEMEAIVTSPDFQNWAFGKIPDDYIFFFKKKEADASWIDLKFNFDTTLSASLPTNIIPPHPMDLAFLQLTAQASARAQYNFDSLFIPFRCVASDVYANEAIVFSEGDLGSSVRASMTFPFYFKPITIKGRLLFDGGIYNNFPIDVMIQHFKPDYIIGSAVSSNTLPPTEDNLMLQLENMIVSNSNYEVPDSNGILIKPDVRLVKLMDFHMAKELIQIGYGAATAQMNHIKRLIPVRQDTSELNKKRKEFRQSFKPLNFKNIYVSGLTYKQSLYLLKNFMYKKDTITFETFKKEYYKIIADDHIESIFPRAKYNEYTGFFNLFLNVKREKPFKARIGGIVSSDNLNGGFLGAEYKYLRKSAYSLYSNIYFGKFYSSLYGRLRIDNMIPFSFYWNIFASLNRYDYYRGSSFIFYEDKRPLYIFKGEMNVGTDIGLPIKNQAKFSTGLYVFDFDYSYYQTIHFSVKDTADITYYSGISPFICYERNSLNNYNLPTNGHKLKILIQYFNGTEEYKPGSTSHHQTNIKQHHSWIYTLLETNDFFKISRKQSLNCQLKIAYSTRILFSNYMSTKLISPSYSPSLHSQSIYSDQLRNPSFIGGGLSWLFHFTENIHFQLASFHFIPYEPILKNDNHLYVKSNNFGIYRTFAAATLFFTNPVANISLSLNYYPWNPNKIFGQFNIGFLIFNRSAHP